GRYTDGAGRRHQVKLSASKEIARRMLAKLAGDAQLAGVGIDNAIAEQQGRPLLEHLEDFRRFMAAKGVTAGYVGKACSHVRAVIEGCSFRTIQDLDAAAVVEFLAELRRSRPLPEVALQQEWYTAVEAAPLLGMTPADLRLLAKRGPWVGPPRRKEG